MKEIKTEETRSSQFLGLGGSHHLDETRDKLLTAKMLQNVRTGRRPELTAKFSMIEQFFQFPRQRIQITGLD